MLLRTFFVRADKYTSSFLLNHFIVSTVGMLTKIYVTVVEVKRWIGLQEICKVVSKPVNFVKLTSMFPVYLTSKSKFLLLVVETIVLTGSRFQRQNPVTNLY